MNIAKKTYGFALVEKKKVAEINSMVRLFRHDSGAELLHIENDDDNKVFAITFRTPPENSKGIPHILEHSVLCGSRKYPIKEPFVELLKGSFKTFLNAMTFADKTMYPVASTNEKDFVNLMDVYLDAVFYPNIYEQPEILMQEGWHHELNKKEDEISIKGVVYNEMQGAFSSPEQILFRNIQHSLFPDHVYGFESGGDPDDILNLSYEEFIDFHKRYYHPSNSRIFVYGDGPVEDRLKFFHEEYLEEFSESEIDSDIPLVKHWDKPDEIEKYYPISADEDEKEKTYLSMNFVTGESNNLELSMAMGMLDYILMESPAAPLKKALLESRLGKDVFGSYNNHLRQPFFSIIVKNSESKRKTEFSDLLYSTLEKIMKNGIDKKLIEAAINIIEFHLREADFGSYPKGLVYCMEVMNSWNYNGNPIQALEYETSLKKIKSALTTNYFEKLIDKYLMNNAHRNLLVLSPEKNLAEKKAEMIRRKMASLKHGLSENDVEKMISQTESLKRKQSTPDSPEDLAKIPSLSLDEIQREAEILPMEEKTESGLTVLSHDIFTSGISYVNLYFDTTVIPKEKIQYLPILARLMGEISTEKYHYSNLSNEINIHTGGIGFANSNYVEDSDDSTYYPKMVVKGKALSKKLPKLFELMKEIINHTKFDDKNRIREVIQESKSRMEMSISEAGHSVASSRLFSYFSQAGKYNEITTGLSYYKFISDLEGNFDERYPVLVKILKEITAQIFNKNNLLVSVTQFKDDYSAFADSFSTFLEGLRSASMVTHDYQFELSTKNEGLLTPANVQYVAKGFNFKHLGHKYTGSMAVFSGIARLDYMWNRIRVQGGAYGAFAVFGRSGNVYLGTYRDPNLRESLDAFDQMADYYRQFAPEEKEMSKYIIGTISQLDSPLTPSMKGSISASRYISHISQEDIQKNRDEVLNTSSGQIRDIAEILDAMMHKDRYCVLGNENRIKEESELFGELVKVFE